MCSWVTRIARTRRMSNPWLRAASSRIFPVRPASMSSRVSSKAAKVLFPVDPLNSERNSKCISRSSFFGAS